MTITGKLIHKLVAETGTSAKGEWTKQTFVIETPGEYPKKIAFDIWNNKVDMSKFKQGQELTVSINIESREGTGRWFTNINAWKIEGGDEQAAEPLPASTPAEPLDDLPF